ncbi:tRNA (adenosine(37)-N6)-dimethylallyltransferase MiaA [Arenibacter sp. M-2]|uniref:tRNA (adenosine(37)-N6)-dimethylallyltransferase MiaA n=1 Tax=unclassified Arenibacter TaxID=2615047 RepID=UPI000D75EFCD|nr:MULTISPECIES: tRNA (adenosine(37)-N6)-dimethylallyltransferase MiaA [unclassified Arenibacter]MDL5513820.1 tRNA (adenosine(37)-N6)-dimethylallyltransferase MiaA [Arenibacter sp. M-2]PXX23483.1 tRNA dimethylallyltransferase [Arenibacter sp. ARW7G5Y1]
MNKKNLISIVGPTAIGKTSLAIAIAKHFKTEIISADSRQFFKEMSIGTAVPSPEELASVPHHFIQHKNIYEEYTVGDFEREAIEKLEILFQANDIVVMVGGSGLYVDAIKEGLDHFPTIDPEIRETLNENLKSKGIISLQERLKVLDRDYYGQVDLNNPHRLIRALEVCIGSGFPYSSFLNQQKPERNFSTHTIAINAERAIVYDRINQRVDIMMEQGLLEEVMSLKEHQHLNALQTVGYRELFGYFKGDFDLDTAVAEIKKNTRRFAKRQLTWLRKKEDILWVDYKYDLNDLLRKLAQKLNGQ